MRHSVILVVYLSAPLWAWAGPANGPTHQTPGQEPARAEPARDQRRAALRQALIPAQQQDAAPASADSPAGRQLSPAERAELRRQLRDQFSR